MKQERERERGREREREDYKTVHKILGYTVLREHKPLLDSMVHSPERPCEVTGLETVL